MAENVSFRLCELASESQKRQLAATNNNVSKRDEKMREVAVNHKTNQKKASKEPIFLSNFVFYWHLSLILFGLFCSQSVANQIHVTLQIQNPAVDFSQLSVLLLDENVQIGDVVGESL